MAVNCWQYAREVYLVGRSVKFRTFTEKERTAVIEFITKMIGTRPAYVPYINLKADNPGRELALQNDYALGKMIQKIGRSLKIQFCTEEEKVFCDALFEATDGRRNQEYNGYVTDQVEEEAIEQSETEEEGTEANQEEIPAGSSETEEESSEEEGTTAE